MSSLSKPFKVGIFYDGNYFLHVSNYYCFHHRVGSRLSLGGLHSYIISKLSTTYNVPPEECFIVEAQYFRGRLSASEAAQKDRQLYNDRVFEDILMSEGISTNFLPLKTGNGKKEEKGLSVWLSLEVFDRARDGEFDMVVLIAADSDFAPLLRKLKSIGVRTMLIGWDFTFENSDGILINTRVSQELYQQATVPMRMFEIVEKAINAGDDSIGILFDGPDTLYDNSNDRDTSGIEPGSRQTGTILTLKNNYGFIKFPNNNLFFHAQDFNGDFATLQEGDTVEFDVDLNSLGQQVAKNISYLPMN